ncbi:MAG: DUF2846 domain-containing protein [Candidatus Lokiarchaeota archaeon]|nr:DUF2846 domain-containing protein [Candidatus Lokiarchaeota archaeon]
MSEQDLKNMVPPEGKALIYIIRSKSQNKAAKFQVFINGKYIGSTKGKNFLYAVVDPGSYMIASNFRKGGHELPMEIEAGKTYFILQKVRQGGLLITVKMYLTDDVEGRARLNKCKLSKLLAKE